jgi:hypothetical protein
MTDKTKSNVKEDASKDTPTKLEAAVPEQVKADATGDDKAPLPAKDQPEKASIETGNDTIDAGTGDTTTTEAEGTEDETAAATLDTVKIKDLIEQIENAGGQSSLDLVHRLIQEEGLKPVDGEDGREMVAMAGVSCRAQKSPGVTLQNWCNAARRALLKAA